MVVLVGTMEARASAPDDGGNTNLAVGGDLASYKCGEAWLPVGGVRWWRPMVAHVRR
jgi:hypothetical protein